MYILQCKHIIWVLSDVQSVSFLTYWPFDYHMGIISFMSYLKRFFIFRLLLTNDKWDNQSINVTRAGWLAARLDRKNNKQLKFSGFCYWFRSQRSKESNRVIMSALTASRKEGEGGKENFFMTLLISKLVRAYLTTEKREGKYCGGNLS